VGNAGAQSGYMARGGFTLVDVQYAEYDAIHRNDFIYDVPNGLDAWLLIFAQTSAVFHVNGRDVTYPANTITLFKPKQKIYYRACEDRFANDWIRFTTDEAFVEHGAIPGTIPISVSQQEKLFHRLFQLICYEKERNGAASGRVIGMLLEIIFTKLGELVAEQSGNSTFHSLQELRSSIYRHPDLDWNLTEMAAKLFISPGHLSTLYKKAFGVTCKADLINSRIDMAKKYLLNSMRSIGEIAELCGYQNIEHFVRQFKEATSYTPGNYRKDHAFTGQPLGLNQEEES
jgi:AraC-like DNA-binding protein